MAGRRWRLSRRSKQEQQRVVVVALMADKKFEKVLDMLGRSITGWSQRQDRAENNLVIIVMDDDVGLAEKADKPEKEKKRHEYKENTRRRKRSRTRDRAERHPDTKDEAIQMAIDSLNTEEKHMLRMSLKKAGRINAMYQTGKTANECLRIAISTPRRFSIWHMAAHKDPKKVLEEIKEELEHEEQRGRSRIPKKDEDKEEARRRELKASRRKAKEETPEKEMKTEEPEKPRPKTSRREVKETKDP